MASTPPEATYIHGTSPEEQRRLSVLNGFINDGSLRELGLRGGESVLDVGCGLAQLTRAMARAVGATGRVVGVEKDPAQLAEAKRQAAEVNEEQLLDLREGDAYTLPLFENEWGAFDIAHARFVLEHVGDPLRVVRGMVQAVRPGGRIVLEDDDHEVLRLHPEPPGFRSLWEAYMRTYDRLGNDPYVGRRLVSLLHQAGARPVRNTWIFFGSCASQPTFDAVVNNALSILRGARETILRQSLLDPAVFDETLTHFAAWGKRPDAAFWFSICWAEGVRPA
jgi:ubiquinone/menaquinone biosynthesis C-methylase UbiE